MKRLLLLMLLGLSMWVYAGIIVTKENGNIEDVTNITVEIDLVSYIENGEKKTVDRKDVSAILYDNGKYEEIKPITVSQKPTITADEGQDSYDVQPQNKKTKNTTYTSQEIVDGAKAYNVWAYGVYAGMGYFQKKGSEDINVEYRIIYKSQAEEPEFTYLGTTPFAYATDQLVQSSFVGKGNPYLMSLLENKPLVIPNDKEVKKIEIRLSKPGYKTTIVKPLKDVLIGCGPVLMISLDKIKPLKDGEVEDMSANQNIASPTSNTNYSSEPIVTEYEPVEETPKRQKSQAHVEDEYADKYGSNAEPKKVVDEWEPQTVYAPEPEPEPAPEPKRKKEIVFRASKSFVEFPENGGETRIDVTSDEMWEVAEKPSWVTARQNGDVLVVKVAQNERPSDREGDIVLLNEHQVELQIVVAQARNSDYLKLSAQLINDKDGEGGLYTLTISSNKKWSVNTSADWCTTERIGENLEIRLVPNKSGESRSATIEIAAQQSALPKQVITVRQSPLSHYIKLHPNLITSSGKGGEATINVETDMPEYHVEGMPNWCRINHQTSTSFVIEIADNSGGAAREAQIKVAIEGGKSETLSVKQAERLNYVTVSPKIISASQRGGVITVNVNGSGAWRVVNIPEWCQVTNQTSDSFTLSIEKNETGAPRNASFSVSVTGIREQIEVRQQ